MARRVLEARARAAARGVRANAELDAAALEACAPLTRSARRLLEALVRDGRLSGRGVQRIRRVARTAGDLAGHDGPLDEAQVAVALALRTAVGPGAIGVAS